MVTRCLLILSFLAALIGLAPAVAPAHPAAPAVGPVTSVAPLAAAVPRAGSGLPVRALSSLPAQATDTVRLVQRGGPYPDSRDGTVVRKREGRLPARSGGHHREYTVVTPGSPDRGARRIVTGSLGEYYYTGDHHGSVVVVDVSR